MLGEALGAIATLQQESLPCRDARQGLLQGARLACKHQRRKGRELSFNISQGLPVRIIRHLHDRLVAPTIGRPALHDAYSGRTDARPTVARLALSAIR